MYLLHRLESGPGGERTVRETLWDEGLKAQCCCLCPWCLKGSQPCFGWAQALQCALHGEELVQPVFCGDPVKGWLSWWTLSMVWLQVNAPEIFSFTAVKYLDRLVAELLTHRKEKKSFVDNWDFFSFLLLGCTVVSLYTCPFCRWLYLNKPTHPCKSLTNTSCVSADSFCRVHWSSDSSETIGFACWVFVRCALAYIAAEEVPPCWTCLPAQTALPNEFTCHFVAELLLVNLQPSMLKTRGSRQLKRWKIEKPCLMSLSQRQERRRRKTRRPGERR